MTTSHVVGKSLPRVEGPSKARGEARYTADIALPGALWGKVLHSPYAHARIVRIDTTAARAVRGVRAVITAADTGPGLYGRLIKDIPVLARDEVRFVGERVAAVAADDEDIAQAALDLIEVEYEELPAVFDPIESSEAGAPLLHPNFNTYPGVSTPQPAPSNVYASTSMDRGDVEAGFAAADMVIEHTYTTPRVHQAYLEPHVCAVEITGDDVQVWACSKAPYAMRDALAAAVGIEPERIVVNHAFIGGDFGGKGAPLDLPIAYYLARATGKPVRIVPDYIEEFMAGNPRHSTVIRLRTGVTLGGTLTAHHVMFIVNSGAYAGYKPRGVIGGATAAVGPYKFGAARVESQHVYTNTVPGGHYRAPGEPQALFALESHMDEIARAIHMDPLAFRLHNLIEDGEETTLGERPHGVRAKETLSAAAASATGVKPRYVGRGLALGHRGPGGGEGSGEVTLYPDGSVVVKTPIFDQGTGVYTLISQIVADEFEVDPARVKVEVWNTGVLDTDSGIGGSRGTRVNSAVAYEAAQSAKRELMRAAIDVLGWPEDHTVTRNGMVVNTETEEVLSWPELLQQTAAPVTGTAHIEDTSRAEVTSFAAQMAEVSVDPETGEVKVLRIVSAHDVGRILNPVGHQGQINGGVIQGLGFAMMEELQLESGRVTTLSFGDYKIPTIRDIPPLETILLESDTGVGPYHIRGIGESPIGPVAPAIANAIFDAVGVRIRDLPITSEKVYRALHAQR